MYNYCVTATKSEKALSDTSEESFGSHICTAGEQRHRLHKSRRGPGPPTPGRPCSPGGHPSYHTEPEPGSKHTAKDSIGSWQGR